MSWYELMNSLRRNDTQAEDTFALKLKNFLLELPDLKYDEVTAQQTVNSVMNLDNDLLEYVRAFIYTGENRWQTLKAIRLPSDNEDFDGDEFFSTTNYNPVTAALFFQSLRLDSQLAIRSFLFNDRIE